MRYKHIDMPVCTAFFSLCSLLTKIRTVDELILFESSFSLFFFFGSHLLARTLNPFWNNVQSMKRAPCGARDAHRRFSHHNPFIECAFLWKCIMYIKTPYLIYIYWVKEGEWMNWNFFGFSSSCLLLAFLLLSHSASKFWLLFRDGFLPFFGSPYDSFCDAKCPQTRLKPIYPSKVAMIAILALHVSICIHTHWSSSSSQKSICFHATTNSLSFAPCAAAVCRTNIFLRLLGISCTQATTTWHHRLMELKK